MYLEDEGLVPKDSAASPYEISLLKILKKGPFYTQQQIGFFSSPLSSHSDLFLRSVCKNLSFKSIISLFSISKAASDTIF